jgi:hypothetical protein
VAVLLRQTKRRGRSLPEPTTSSPAPWLLCWSGRHGGGRRPGRPGPASSAASAATRPALLTPGGWSPQPSATAERSQPETQAGTADECVARGLLSGGRSSPASRSPPERVPTTPGPIATAKSGHASANGRPHAHLTAECTNARSGWGRSARPQRRAGRLSAHRPETEIGLLPLRPVGAARPPRHGPRAR